MASLVLVAVALLCVSSASSQLFEGDVCTQENGSPGVCKMVENCPGAEEQIISGNLPIVCSYKQYEPVVCCNVAPPVRRTTTTRKPRTTTTKPKPTRPTAPSAPARLADRKCREYGRYVFWETEGPTLSILSQKYNASECAMVAETLIVGGVKAGPKEFPHMAVLGYGEGTNIQWLCGGSLISERYVLTAAHCLSSRGSGVVRWVRLGDLNIASSEDTAEPITVGVSERIRHSQYAPPAHYHDIALLKLDNDVKFTPFIRPACLYTKPGNPPGVTNATASGWGKLEWTEEAGSQDLMKVDLALQDVSRCNKTFAVLIRTGTKLLRGVTPDTMICAGDPYGLKDTCGGDSGGPLQIKLNDPFCMYSIIGLTSFGVSACGVGDNPAVYTRVSYYVPWIEKIVWS